MADAPILSLPFKPFFTTSVAAVVLADLQGKILVANPAFLKLAGQSSATMNDRPILDFIAAEKNQEARDRLDALVQDNRGRDEFNTLLTHVNGEKLPITLGLALVLDASDRPLCLMLTFSESAATTETRRVRQAVTSLTTGDLWSQVLDRIPQSLLLINFAHHIEGINRHAESAFGYSKSELQNRPIEKLFPDLMGRIPEPGSATAARQPVAVHVLHKSGYKIPLLLDLKPVHFESSFYWLAIAQNPAGEKLTDEPGKSAYWRDLASGLFNRMVFQEQLGHAIKRAGREDELLGVLLLRLDRFKQLNESLGLEAGNHLLKEAGARIAEFVRRSDCVVQVGGDKYAILLEGIRHAEHVSIVTQKLSSAFIPPFRCNNEDVFMSVSIGISVFPVDGGDAEQLIKNAESAMHQQIKEGGNAFLFYTPALHSRAMERMHMENELRRALKNEEFVVHYQPMLNADGDRITCLEALVRWNHPRKGLIPPAAFIPLLEETGLIAPVGEWVLRSACQYINKLRSEGHGNLRVSVNLSARQFMQHDFIGALKNILQETQVDPQALDLEITESVLIKNAEENWDALKAVAACGIRIVLDDFGTGCSSLSYLKHFPIHTLKIDRNFVKGLPDQRGDMAITDAILVLAVKLGMTVVAEGVETEAQLDYLRRRDCHEMQGFLFARPMPMAEVGPWLRNRGR